MIMLSMITQIPVISYGVRSVVWQATCVEKAHPAFERTRCERVEKNTGSVRPERETLAPAAVLCAAEAGMVDGLEMVDGMVWG